jgi:4'-phosphopantetheinyl transferase
MLAQLRQCLSDDEKARTDARLTPSGKRHAVVSRALLRHLLAGVADRPPESFRFDVGTHGRPALALPVPPILDFNLSHSGDEWLCAVLGDEAAFLRVGVDLERNTRPRNIPLLAERVLTDTERDDVLRLPSDAQQRRFLRYWTLKEAFSKAIGTGFTIGFNRLEFDLNNDPPRAVTLPDGIRPEDWTFAFIEDGAVALFNGQLTMDNGQ